MPVITMVSWETTCLSQPDHALGNGVTVGSGRSKAGHSRQRESGVHVLVDNGRVKVSRCCERSGRKAGRGETELGEKRRVLAREV